MRILPCMRHLIVIAHDIRSTHNVGSLFRTAECMGAKHVYLTGYTPYPTMSADDRLPHLSRKISAQIEKTALGTIESLRWSHDVDVLHVIAQLRDDGYTIVALEQTPSSLNLVDWSPPNKVALLLGREVEGIEPSLLEVCDINVEIPQFGKKESLNVIQAAAIAIYHIQVSP